MIAESPHLEDRISLPSGRQGLAMDQLIEDYLKDCQSGGMAIEPMPRYRSVLRIYQ